MNLLLPYAYDTKRTLVHIANAHKGQIYTCPNCGNELLLKIGKIPEGQKYHRRNHFAHKGNTDNHCSESFLHKLFKEKCVELIEKKLAAKEELYFSWKCNFCPHTHRDNLLDNVSSVKLEYSLGIFRPDIALLDQNNNTILVIEIIVNHPPEVETLQYYNKNNIGCLQINVTDFDDCQKIETKLSNPDKVNLCLTPLNETNTPTPQNNSSNPQVYGYGHYSILEKYGSQNCPKCGGNMLIKVSCIGRPYLICEKAPQCPYKETESDFDHILFPSMNKDAK